jgi:hypothetical protein
MINHLVLSRKRATPALHASTAAVDGAREAYRTSITVSVFVPFQLLDSLERDARAGQLVALELVVASGAVAENVADNYGCGEGDVFNQRG